MRLEEKTKRELLALEEQYWNAMKDRDSATATSLSDHPCVVVGAQGVGEIDRKTMASMLEDAPWELKRFALEDVHFQPVSDDVVVLAYKVKEDLIVDGEEIELEAFDSSVWALRDGDWVCVAHTESPAGDPFGRG